MEKIKNNKNCVLKITGITPQEIACILFKFIDNNSSVFHNIYLDILKIIKIVIKTESFVQSADQTSLILLQKNEVQCEKT